MKALRYGKNGQVSFDSWHQYYYVLGFLANGRNAELRWEHNEEQGAWGSEGRVHCLIPESQYPQCFQFTAGIGKVYARVNCNDYVNALINDHNFTANSRTQNVNAIILTIPKQFVSVFWEGYNK